MGCIFSQWKTRIYLFGSGKSESLSKDWLFTKTDEILNFVEI